MPHRIVRAVLSLALLAVAAPALAEDLFVVDVQTTSGAPLEDRASDSSLIDLVESLVERDNDFEQFDNRDIRGTVTYAGVKDAMIFELNDDKTSATLTIPSTGFTKTFTGDNEDELEEEITEFLEKDGADELADFLNEMNQRSVVAVTDGNPQSTTARMGESTFRRYAFLPSFIQTSAATESHQLGGGQFRVDLAGGAIDTDNGDGAYFNGIFSSTARFNEALGLSSGMTLGYRDIEGSGVYDLGFDIGLPISIIQPNEDLALNWTVTPFAQIAAAVSPDFAAGGVLAGGGIANHLGVQVEGTTISMGNQISFFEGLPISYSDYEFDTDLSQQLLKNGVKVSQMLGESLFVDVGIIHSCYVDDAAVQDWITPGVGIGGAWEGGGVRASYAADRDDDYKAHSGWLHFYFVW